MAVDNLKEKLAGLVSKEPSQWVADVQYREENKSWLKRSQAIAIMITKTLREQRKSQLDLANAMGVSPQQVNKIVKGKENLTLETIAKIEQALNIELISVPKYTISKVYTPEQFVRTEIMKIEQFYQAKSDFSELQSFDTELTSTTLFKMAC
ncbi:helix-turn-helix domain-containing protein [Solitalea lacus]|uniref:helix-turn-helix domain-containing protein n=1 Tax=Solitalea lacus TaxID=2911172 RepID=UPI001EDAFB0B|nr:helix-turn-helix transcriptional regulator [Solitalea lacus]UKJ07925.1 helix-turn-helix domain-containing protein [Solitalea lacus]